MTALVIFTNQMLRRRADCPPPSGVCGATAREARRRGGDAFARLDACAAGAGTPLLDSTPAPPLTSRDVPATDRDGSCRCVLLRLLSLAEVPWSTRKFSSSA